MVFLNAKKSITVNKYPNNLPFFLNACFVRFLWRIKLIDKYTGNSLKYVYDSSKKIPKNFTPLVLYNNILTYSK